MGKKVISMVMVWLLSCGILLQGYAAPAAGLEDTASMYTEEEIDAYYQLLDLFRHLGAFTLNEEIQTVVTRARFVELLIDFIGLEEMAGSLDAKGTYTDLEEMEYAQEMEYAVESGLIRAYSPNEFRPEDALLFEDAIISLTAALGYDKIVRYEYGLNADVTAYMVKASEIGLLKGIEQSAGYPVVYGELMQLFENALTIELMNVRYTNEGAEYSFSGKETLLSTVYKAEERTGIVTANSYTDIVNGGDPGKGTITIDNIRYPFLEEQAELIGHRVHYYVRMADGEEELVYVSSLLKSDDVLNISGEEIEDFQNRTYDYYDEKGKRRRIQIPTGCILLYNGRLVTNLFALDEKILYPEDGTIQFIDNDQDGQYDILRVERFDTYVVESIDTKQMKIFDKLHFEKYLSLEKQEDSMILVEDLSGNRITAQQIKVGQVLSVAKSADEALVRIIVSDKAVSGVISAVTEESVFIGETEYKRSSYSDQELPVGSSGEFLLDRNDRAVYFRQASQVKMGYLINAGFESALSQNLQLKILTESGSIEILSCAESFVIDNHRFRNHTDGYAQLKGALQNVFTYKQNSDGRICELYTIFSETENDCPPQRLQVNTKIADSAITYNAWPSSFKDFKTYLDADTVIFCIPEDPLNAPNSDFYVCRTDALAADEAYSSPEKPLTTYTLGEQSFTASCMVMDSNFLIKDYRIGVVCHITPTIDGEKEPYTDIGIFNYGTTDSYRLYDREGINLEALSAASVICSADLYKLEVGDVILFDYEEKNGMRLIKNIKILYDVISKEYLYTNPSSSATVATSAYYFGDVYEKGENYISVVLSQGDLTGTSIGVIGDPFDKTSSNYFVEYIAGATICKYWENKGNPIVSLDASISEIVPYVSAGKNASKVFVFTGRGSCVFCYIVE